MWYFKAGGKGSYLPITEEGVRTMLAESGCPDVEGHMQHFKTAPLNVRLWYLNDGDVTWRADSEGTVS